MWLSYTVWPLESDTYNFIFDGCESISPPMMTTPFNFTLPVNLKTLEAKGH